VVHCAGNGHGLIQWALYGALGDLIYEFHHGCCHERGGRDQIGFRYGNPDPSSADHDEQSAGRDRGYSLQRDRVGDGRRNAVHLVRPIKPVTSGDLIKYQYRCDFGYADHRGVL
jgi:hypothetical protein